MSIRMHNPYEEPDSSANRLLLDLLLLSLLAHAVIITLILLISAFMPPEALPHQPVSPTVSLSLVQPPKPIFVPTTPDADAKHKQQLIESANDTNLKSKSQKARAPDSIMPDVIGKEHAPDLNNKPNVQAPPKKQEVSSTPPTPKQAQPEKPTPPQPKPQPAPPTPPKPPQPAPKSLPPTPPKKAPPQIDANGFPILPPLNVPTMAPQNQAVQPAAPAPSQLEQASSIHGAISLAGDNSPAAMATDLGKYKQYVRAVVGSFWYPDIDQHFGTIGVGTVRIQFTIHSDGTISNVIVHEGDNLEILKNISRNALIAPAPYKPFPEALIKQVGDSYTDEVGFQVY